MRRFLWFGVFALYVFANTVYYMLYGFEDDYTLRQLYIKTRDIKSVG